MTIWLKNVFIFIGFLSIATTTFFIVPTVIEIEWTSLYKDKDLDLKSNQYGHRYLHYLVGVNGTKEENNNLWWDLTFNKIYKNSTLISQKFQNITSGYEGENSLRYVCNSAYKSLLEKVRNTDVSNSDFLETDVWKFCSGGNRKPTTILDMVDKYSEQDSNHIENTYAKDKTKEYIKWGSYLKDILLSTYDKENEWVWEIKDKLFKDLILLPEDPSSYFNAQEEKTVKEMCMEVYEYIEHPHQVAALASKQEVKDFCSI